MNVASNKIHTSALLKTLFSVLSRLLALLETFKIGKNL